MMRFGWVRLAAFSALCWAEAALAGGSGLNALVVVNANSSNSVALGNYYCEMRQVPPQNLIRMSNWSGGNVSWTLQQFTNTLLVPLHAAVKSRGLTNQADFVLLSMDIPYRVENGGHANSTTAALYYGFKTNEPSPSPGSLPDSCTLPDASSNNFSGSEREFRSMGLGAASWTNLLTSMVTASNLAVAKSIVSQGSLSDSTFPTQAAYLVKSPSDGARNVRYQLADNAAFDSRIQGIRPLIRTNRDGGIPPVSQMSGAQTGWMNYNPFVTTFAPGALADNLTSIGGKIFEWNDHLKIIDLLRAGASGTYGTIIEPCNYLEKFPTPQALFYQTRGFVLAECYYMGLTNPYQGLVMGDPLAAPYALAPAGYWTNVPALPLSGTAALNVRAFATSADQPVAQVDLYVDGVWNRTLTNVEPRQGNSVTVTIDGISTLYSVPASATAHSVAAGLVAALNTGTKMAQTKTRATAFGDRIQLSRTNGATSGSQVPVTVQTSQGSASALATHARTELPAFLDTEAFGVRAYTVQMSGSASNRYLAFAFTKTNGAVVNIAVTNTAGTTLGGLVQNLASAVNSSPLLTGPEGVALEDTLDYGTQVDFNLRVRSVGWNAAQFAADLSGNVTSMSPSSNMRINENATDLQPRNHVYIASGFSSILLTFNLDTTTLANGHHELTAVIMEGGSVRAQRRVSTNVVIQNGALTGNLTTLMGGTNSALEATLQFAVSGSGASISKVELFSTGGLLGSSNLPSAVFSVPGVFLGPGLHPVYGIVTSAAGQQYRTHTQWVRILDYEPAFRVSASAAPLTLSWPATAGRAYTILSTTNLTTAFQPAGAITPTNSLGLWPVTNSASKRFFKIRAGI